MDSNSINPWTAIWFSPQKTAVWARDHRPLYGVLVLLLLHVVVTLIGFSIEGPEAVTSQSGTSQAPLDVKHKLGLYLDVWVMPVVLVFVLHWIVNRFGSNASLKNILWVVVWSQLPVILLTLISLAMEMTGMRILDPLFANKLITKGGQLFIDPPILQLNTDGIIYFAISTVLFLWSFQILLSGGAAVSGVTVKRALWFLTMAMIALMLIRLPFTMILGDRDLLDILGLNGILET